MKFQEKQQRVKLLKLCCRRPMSSLIFWLGAFGFLLSCTVESFLLVGRQQQQQYATISNKNVLQYSASNETDSSSATTTTTRRPCFYKNASTKNRWHPRIELEDLQIGQELQAVVVQELLNGKTGPKVFVDCGVGRTYDDQTWKLQTAMLRLGPIGMKPSVATKKASRLRKKEYFTVYVSRIRPSSDQMEVVLTPEEAALYKNRPKLIPIGQVQAGQEYTNAMVTKVCDFGVLMNIGANREGLLHITRVAELYGWYIDKSQGLQTVAGLKRGTIIPVQVISNEKKRLYLDYTEEYKQRFQEKRRQKRKRKEEQTSQKEQNVNDDTSVTATTTKSTTTATISSSMSAEELAALEAQYNIQQEEAPEEEEEDDDEYDSYDEERDIEDQLGLGTW